MNDKIVFTYTYPSGKLMIKGAFANNVQEGEWFEYFECGKVKRIVNYIGGVKHGKCYIFKEDGRLQYCKEYKNGHMIFFPKIRKSLHLRRKHRFQSF